MTTKQPASRDEVEQIIREFIIIENGWEDSQGDQQLAYDEARRITEELFSKFILIRRF